MTVLLIHLAFVFQGRPRATDVYTLLYEQSGQCVLDAQPLPVSQEAVPLCNSLLSLQFNPLLSETAIQKMSLNQCFRTMDASRRLSG